MKTFSSHKSNKASYRFWHWALPTYFWILHLLCWICLAAEPPPSNFATNKDKSAYADCVDKKTQSCVGVGGTECIETKSCVIFVTYYVTDNGGTNNSENRVYFQLILQQQLINYIENHYLAIGISTDKKMGGDIVMSCNQFKKSAPPFSAQLSYNHPSEYENIFVSDSKTQSLLVKDEMLVLDGKTYCSFSIPAQLSVGPVQINLNSTSRHLLIAVGRVTSIQDLKHHQHSYFTSQPLNFRLSGQQLVISDSEEKRYIYIFGHVTLMVITFLTISPTSMMIGRFFKESHVKQRVCHKKLWFILHLFGVCVGTICITVSLALITTYAGVLPNKSISKYLTHYCLGIIIVILYANQMILGCYLGVSLVDSYTFTRGISSNFHYINGTLIQVLSLLQIFLSPKLLSTRLRYCSTGSVILIVWIVVYICAYAALTTIMLRSDMAEFKLLTVKDEITYHAEKNNDDSSILDRYVPEDDSTWDGFRRGKEAKPTSVKNDSIDIDGESDALKPKSRSHRATTPKLKQKSGTSNDVGVERKASVSKSAKTFKKSSSQSTLSKKMSRLNTSKMSTISKSKSQQQSPPQQNQHLPKNKFPPLSTTGSLTSAKLPLHRQSSRHKGKSGSLEKQNNLKGTSGSSPKSGSRKSRSRRGRSADAAADREHASPTSLKKNSKKSRTQSKLGDEAFLPANKSNKVGPDLVPHSRSVHSIKKSGNSPETSFDADEPEVKDDIDIEMNHEESQPRSFKHKNDEWSHHQKLSSDMHPVYKPSTKKKAGASGASASAGAPIDIVPRRKQIIYDEYPDYDNETVVSTPTAYRSTRKVTSKRIKHDPRRALTTYPMQVYFTREHPKTRLLDTIIAIFFVTSVVMSVGLVYALGPYDGHGMDHCESESWMADFP